MNDERVPMDEWLLDDHLDQLTDEDRRRLLRAMRDDPGLARRHHRLQRVLEPLDAWTPVGPAGNLVGRILDRLAADRSPVLSMGNDRSVNRGLFGSRIRRQDIMGLAAVIALTLLLIVPGLSEVRARARQAVCAHNLGDIGHALAAYAAAYQGVLPQASMREDTHWLPVGAPRGVHSPNSRSRFLLLRFRHVADAQRFVCPSRGDAVPLNLVNPDAVDDFPDPRNCTYDSLNVAGPVPHYEDQSQLPYMADANPLFAGGRVHRIDPRVSNSPNHRPGRGQNVLRIDGHVVWTTNPHCGVGGDNIWQAGATTIYTGVERQTSPRDTFLIP